MPGGIFCCIVGCSTSQLKNPFLSFHGFPKQGLSAEKDDWRKQLVVKVARCDSSFKPDTAKICSRHFEESCFKIQPSGRRALIPGSLPTKFMPSRSVEIPKPTSRKPPRDRQPPDLECHEDLEDHEPQDAPDLLPCPGIIDPTLQRFAELPPRRDQGGKTDSPSCPYYLHVVYHPGDDITTCSTTVRAHACKRVLDSPGSELCSACAHAKSLVKKKYIRRIMAEKRAVARFAPLSRLSKSRVTNALKIARLEKKAVDKQLEDIRAKLDEDSVAVSDTAHGTLSKLMDTCTLEKDSFVSKFWSEQKKAFERKSRGMRWHPMFVRFAILLHSQSPSAYRALREIGVLKLPAESTLRDYTNVLHPRSGFHVEVFTELKEMAADLQDKERWVCLLHDEVSIKSDLVYDRRSGELVGFIDSNKWTDASAKDSHLATHALVFMVVGVTSNIKMSLGYFPTRTATADEIFPLLWKAVGLLECVSNLKVIASTSDKASPNQRLIKIHNTFYKAVNIFKPERNIYFFSDAPHLIKTVRNNLSSSGAGKGTKRLWNNRSEILWEHVVRLYKEDSGRELRRTKLTSEHVYLSPQSVMRVYLAAQVLSHTVGRVMQVFGQEDCQETARFLLLMNNFFDCVNTRSDTESARKANQYLLPYRSVDDARFHFLREEFLGYLEQWKASVAAREGFSKSERNRMFLTYQTYDGLRTTVFSTIEAVQYLLTSGVDMVLTNRFCQDPLEAHFGRHRCMGIRSENPSLWTYGYQENKLRMQRSLALAIMPKGNVRSKRAANPVRVDDTPLPKIRRRH